MIEPLFRPFVDPATLEAEIDRLRSALENIRDMFAREGSSLSVGFNRSQSIAREALEQKQ